MDVVEVEGKIVGVSSGPDVNVLRFGFQTAAWRIQYEN
jgi:hypothetical protein